MIPQKYIKGEHKIFLSGQPFLLDGIAIFEWLEDIEEKLRMMRENLLAAGGIILKKPVDGLILAKDNKKAEINFYEDGKKISEIIAEIKDPEKQMLKIYEFTEFLIYNLLAAKGPDGKKIDPERRKQIIDNVLKRLEEEEEKPPRTPKRRK